MSKVPSPELIVICPSHLPCQRHLLQRDGTSYPSGTLSANKSAFALGVAEG
ncbi:hypothetical protein [Calothrix sp. NIES-2098]|uniref:hypothetical protein n=1 Tax=Calothrix sp. NIES-2098 TaxID=1954171 RepID=UPI0030D738B1